MSKHRARRRDGGFSVVELMVSVVVGMVAVMFATRLLATSETDKSAALGGSDSMQNGMLALFSLNFDASQAGWGINDTLVNGCNTLMKDADGFTMLPVKRGGVDTTPLAPVVIVNNGEQSDVISLNSGGSQSGVGNVTLADLYAGGSEIRVTSNNPFGFNPGDVIVVAPEPAGGACSIAQLSQVDMDVLHIASGRYNSGGGLLGGIYNQGSKARVFNLGPADKFALHTWSVERGVLRLRASNMSGSTDAPKAVVDNVVAIKAQYGFDRRPDFDPVFGSQVTTWSADMLDADNSGVAGDAGDFQRVTAVRLAVVARSQVPDKPQGAARTCSTTTGKLTVFATQSPAGVEPSPVTVALDISGDKIHWSCYRYRAFETVVQIRNNAWRP
ncbi:MAG: prepilin-type N-terminal cleavage/methylation protein [Pseudoduganella sp.]|jgi:type IV pilus assembly protein PilW|nr:prepilin-type N-terminal cleavage/methylation protein [Pseudoduganella sp.]